MHALKVLILEDNPFQLMALHQMLNANQIFDVRVASSVADACQALERGGGVDIAICDLQMEGPDGIAFIAYLAQSQAARALILVSGVERGVLDAVAHFARKQGIEVLGCVPKPASAMVLAGLLQRFVERPPSCSVTRLPSLRRSFSYASLCGDMDPQALAGQWIAHFQPKVSLKGQLLGVEALARWQHPRHGLLTPATFMAAIEQAGQLEVLTWRIMEHALQLSSEHLRVQGEPLPVAVNIAPVLLERADFASRVSGLLRRFALPAQVLTLEIVEWGGDEPVAWQLEGLLRLRMQGCKLSIDDFGTGASNIQRLLQLPFSELKIPAEFVRGMADDERKCAAVSGAMLIARRMALDVVVEGVETLDDFHSLLCLGDSAVQGYFIARPMGTTDLFVWIADRAQRSMTPLQDSPFSCK
jgi:EAL domain-containing protein (putative c-di-GMP-specific phosphodiesterase class I)/ActR/RegA family two-component response regulator